jgi:hypothetical protein
MNYLAEPSESNVLYHIPKMPYNSASQWGCLSTCLRTLLKQLYCSCVLIYKTVNCRMKTTATVSRSDTTYNDLQSVLHFYSCILYWWNKHERGLEASPKPGLSFKNLTTSTKQNENINAKGYISWVFQAFISYYLYAFGIKCAPLFFY